MKQKLYSQAWHAGMGVALATLSAGCVTSDGLPGVSETPPTPQKSPTAYALDAFQIKTGASPSRRHVRYAPLSLREPVSTRSHTSAPATVGTGEVTFEKAGILLRHAALLCDGGLGADFSSDIWEEFSPHRNWFGFASKSESSASTGRFTSCDEILRHEQALLCMAGKFSELADAVAPVRWQVEGEDYYELVFPPQSTKNRFVARDVAIIILAHLARLELEQPRDLSEPATYPIPSCFEGYIGAAASQSYAATHSEGLFGVEDDSEPQVLQDEQGDPLTTGTVSARHQEHSLLRLDLNARILSSAGAMLKELIEKSVAADVAGAAAQRAAAADEASGIAAQFGMGGEDNEPNAEVNNNLRHALGVLYGRLEPGRELNEDGPGPGLLGAPHIPKDDPRCGGHSSMLLTGALPEGFVGLLGARVVKTEGQAKAAELVAQLGILPNMTFPADGGAPPSFSAVRTAVADQAVHQAALGAGYSIGSGQYTTFTTGNAGLAVRQTVQSIPDGDLSFGLSRNASIAQYISGQRAPTTFQHPSAAPTVGIGGLRLIDPAETVVSPSLGAVAEGGLPVADAVGTPEAAAGQMMAASQCPAWDDSSNPGIDAYGVDFVMPFQDAFLAGATLQRRLRQMANQLAATTGLAGSGRAAQAAFVGSAAIATWAGPGLATLIKKSGGSPTTEVEIYGLADAELGLQETSAGPPAEYASQVRLVLGEHWEADCAIGARTSCAGADPAHVITATSVEKLSSPIPKVRLNFPGLSSTGETAEGQKGERTIFLISSVGTGSAKRGRILAGFAHRSGYSEKRLVAAISELRNSLLRSVLGAPPDIATDGTRVGGPSLASPTDSCLPGVPANFFVPLENELTGDSDAYESSWRHYLTLARQAAERTDQLGRELIEQGLQKDYRAEAAGEALGEICGSYGSLQGAQIEDGQVGVDPAQGGDQALEDCLKEKTTDVVFLTHDPFVGVSAGTATAQIKADYLGCSDPLPGNAVNPLCSKEELTWEALNLFAGKPVPESNLGACSPALELVESVNRGFNGAALGELAEDVGATGFTAVARSLRIIVSADMHWKLLLDGEELLSTRKRTSSPSATSVNLWPSCLDDDEEFRQDAALHSPYQRLFNDGGDVTTVSASAASRERLLQRVSSVLWLAGVFSGGLPEGTFEIPVPAIDYGESGTEFAAPLGAVYAPGEFDPNGRLHKYDTYERQTSDADLLEVGTTSVVGTTYAAAITGQALRPEWVGSIYQSPSWYRHIATRSAAHSFPAITTTGALRNASQLFNALNSVSRKLDGARGNEGGSCIGSTSTDGVSGYRELRFPVGLESTASYLCGPSGPKRKVPYLNFSRNSAEIYGFFTFLGEGRGPASQVVPYGSPKWKSGGLLRGTNKDTPIVYGMPWESQFPRVPWDSLVTESNGIWQFDQTNPENPNEWHLTQRGANIAGRVLLPSVCTPSRRTHLFINSNNPVPNACVAARELSRSVAGACLFTKQARLSARGASFPLLEKPSDLRKLEEWVADQGTNVELAARRLVLTNVPNRVIRDARLRRVGSGSTEGTKGQLILQYAQGIAGLHEASTQIAGELSSMASAIGTARHSLVGAELSKDLVLQGIAMQRIGLQASIVQSQIQLAQGLISAVSFGSMSDWGTGSAAHVASSILAINSAREQLRILEETENLSERQGANQVAQVLAQLQQSFNPSYTNLMTSLDRLQSSVAAIQSTGAALRQAERSAQYQVAKAYGADYVVGDDGKPVAIPVNTVLRRQHDLTKLRYERSLASAKYLAYMARLAVEQRVGMRLKQVEQPLGTLPPPNKWADDICSFQGVDYSRYRGAVIPGMDGGISDNEFFGLDPNDATQFADPFIGSYVDRLEQFVEFYNIAYPSREGDDVAVISLREHLTRSGGVCERESRNLLYHSDQLHRGDPSGDGVNGWQVSPCAEDSAESGSKCLLVSSGLSLGTPTQEDDGADAGGLTPPTAAVRPPSVAAQGGVTWLHETVLSSPADGGLGGAGGEGGAAGASGASGAGGASGGGGAGAGGQPGATGDGTPGASVYQAVQLRGQVTHLLSWWDLARTVEGLPPTDDSDRPPPYRAAIFDATWTPLAQLTVEAFDPTKNAEPEDDDRFSDDPAHRRVLRFTPPRDGLYYVVFNASLGGAYGGTAGSVALANVQLESAAGTGAPGAYESTTGSRTVLTRHCSTGDGAAFREAFTHRCEDGECFHELKVPAVIDTNDLRYGRSSLAGLLARGNYNYRHLDVALNVVGTGVLDCAGVPGQACYGTGYVEYDLVHTAFNVPILDYFGTAQYFDFGRAQLRHAKALAAERFLTVPLGGTDQGLIAQPAFTKGEFRGRPLDGEYKLRIYDKTSLVWQQLEDLQLVLTYRYWSRIDRQN